MSVRLAYGTVSPETGVRFRFFGRQHRLYEAIRAAGSRGIPSDRLADVIYRDDADGGPCDRAGSIRVMVCMTNKRLAVIGKKIKGYRRNDGSDPHMVNYVLEVL